MYEHPPPVLPTHRPQYQLRQSPCGEWRVRVFNLPVSPAAPLPFVTEVCAGPLGEAVYWREGADGKRSVLRVDGPNPLALGPLLRLLEAHGIPLVGPPGPAPRK